jgi:perosamine synthetase
MAFRFLPPTAIKIKTNDLVQGIISGLDHDQGLERFRMALLDRTGNQHCFLASSGRAALALILTGLKQASDRTQVVIPAYVCPTVVQSVLKAGLEPVVCDVSPETLDLDRSALNRLIGPKLLAVVPAHLYGWAQDIRDLLQLGEQHGFLVIEDAAQAFGAKLDDRMVGTWGDVGYFSLGRGKCIPVGHGGVILSHDRCEPEITRAIQSSIEDGVSRDFTSLATYLGYGLATQPLGWWILVHTPWNPADAGMNACDLEPVRIGNLSKSQAGIGISILDRIDQLQAISKQNARRLISNLSRYDFVTIPEIKPESDPVFLRLPVVVNEEKIEEKLFNLLWQSGSGVSRSYWRTIPEIFPQLFDSYQDKVPGATHLARCLLTLPTHAYLRDQDFDRISRAFQSI